MVQLLKIKERIYRFVGQYEIYVLALIRFGIAFVAFRLITGQVGFMTSLKEYPIPLILALLSSFLPAGMMMFLGVLLILAHFYALSAELCAITALLFVILFGVYLRFSTRKGLYTVLTPVLGAFGIPYVMPVASGLLGQPHTSVSVVCGTVVYFLVKNIKENAALFAPAEEISRSSMVTLAVTEILGDKEMYLYLAAFAAAGIVVSCVRRLKADHSRKIAIIIGIVIQLAAICSGEVYLGNAERIVRVIVGCVISLFLAFALDFMALSLDYSRVENTQFEDDEYYYYVRAVPKAFVTVDDKKVQRINARRTRNRRILRVKNVKKPETDPEEYADEEALEEQVMREFRDSEER